MFRNIKGNVLLRLQLMYFPLAFILYCKIDYSKNPIKQNKTSWSFCTPLKVDNKR